jgi:general secretion pathway protein M
MISASSSKALRRVAALGLVLLALVVAALLASAPFAKSGGQHDEIAALRELIVQRERFLLTATGRPTQNGREALLAGETSGILGAELQRHMIELARRNSLAVRSTQVLPPKRESSLIAVGLELSLQGEIAGVRALLHAVETGTPLLFAEALILKTAPSPQAADKPIRLEITLKVRGYGASKEDK